MNEGDRSEGQLLVDDIVPKRLVVELSRRNTVRLNQLVDSLELNKTNVVNRAIQVLHLLHEIEESGGRIFVQEANDDSPQRTRLVGI